MTRTPLVRAGFTAGLVLLSFRPFSARRRRPGQTGSTCRAAGFRRSFTTRGLRLQGSPTRLSSCSRLRVVSISHTNTVNPPGFIGTGGLGNWERVGNDELAVTQKFAVAIVDASGAMLKQAIREAPS